MDYPIIDDACGRYTYYEPIENIATRYNLKSVSEQIPFNYNVSPGQHMPIIINDGKQNELHIAKWGLIPVWAKDPRIGYSLINARDDSIFVKPVWRKVILSRRALIPANGFYEWRKPHSPKEHKQPFYIHPKQQGLFSFAGVWDLWHDSEGKDVRTYSIITTKPNKEMSAIHDRSPVILHQEDETAWLDPGKSTSETIEPYLVPYEDNGLVTLKVSDEVNSPRNNYKHLIDAVK